MRYKLPEGFELKPEHEEKLNKIVEECELTNEQAQKFVDLHCEILAEHFPCE